MTHTYLITFIKTVFFSSELQNLKKKNNGKLLHIVNDFNLFPLRTTFQLWH